MVDWFPTLIEIAGGSPPPGIDGVSHWEALKNSSVPDARDTFIYDTDKVQHDNQTSEELTAAIR